MKEALCCCYFFHFLASAATAAPIQKDCTLEHKKYNEDPPQPPSLSPAPPPSPPSNGPVDPGSPGDLAGSGGLGRHDVCDCTSIISIKNNHKKQ